MKNSRLIALFVGLTSLVISSCSLFAEPGNSLAYTSNYVESSETTPPSSETWVISFVSNGGTTVDPVVVMDGDLLTKPVDPYKEGFDFAGWYRDRELTVLYDFSIPVHSSFLLYAAWAPIVPDTWTVTFISDGVVIDTQNVIDGGLLTQPANPVKEGSQFGGWFRDIDIDPFDFSTPVRSSFTLTAKWFTQEYMVTFNLNYGDLPPQQLSTEDGFVTYIPQRSGYIFNGWWYCDGIIDGKPILNRSFSMTTRVVSDGLELYAEWVEQKSAANQLDAPVVSIINSTVSWASVQNASGYHFMITSKSGNRVITNVEITTNELSYTIADSSLDPGPYTIQVRANGDGRNHVNSPYAMKTYAHRTLTAPRNFSYNSYKCMLQWDPVLNAESYTLTVDGDASTTVSTINNFYDFSTYDAGSHTVKVTATKGNWISGSASHTFTKLYLNKPSNLSATFNEESGTYDITWEGVRNADSYKVYIDGREVETVNSNLLSCSYSLARNSRYFTNEELSFCIAAFDSNANYIISERTEELVLTKKYLITYELNRGTNNSSNPMYYQANDNEIVLGNPSRKGHSFLGWYEANNLVDRLNPSEARDITIWASWDNGDEYVVTLDSNGGEVDDASLLVNYDEEYELPTPVKKGYAFVGWYDDSVRVPEEGFWSFESDKTLIAGWTIKTFEIQPNCNEPSYGTIEGAGTYGYGDVASLVAIPFAGREFDGWFIDDILVSTEPEYTLEIEEDNIVPTAHFSAIDEMAPYIYISTIDTCTIVGLRPDHISDETIIIPQCVTSIGNSAFENCTNLLSVTIPDSVSAIGQGAFEGCSRLTSISLPFVGGSASSNRFLGYIFGASSSSYNGQYVPQSLKTVAVSGACSSIAAYAFSGCFSLTSIAIQDGVKSIADHAFYHCSSLASITIPDSVISIGESAFYGCSRLTSISLPFVGGSASSNRFLGYIFAAYSYSENGQYVPQSLKTVAVSGACSSIAGHAFYGCSSLTSVAISASVISIGQGAFEGCSSLTSITIPASVTSIGYIFGASSSSSNGSFVPNSLRTVILSGGSSIADYAFYGCSSLTSVAIPDGVTSIGAYAFYGCSSLTSIEIPDGVTSIADHAFYGCSSLTSVAIPDGVTSIANRAFYGCTSLTSVAIPASVTSIGDYAFSGCTSLTSVAIPDGVTSIGVYAFSGCSSLTSVAIPDGVTSIGQGAFEGCSSLTSVAIPDGVTSIGAYAFSGCSSLTSISLPFVGGSASSNRFLGYIFGAYSYLSNGSYVPKSLRTVIISAACSSIADHAFYGCSSLASITIPDSVTSIGDYAFYGCSSLASITIPDGVTSIGVYAFAGCSSLTSIAIPEGVTSIGTSAFYGCLSLESIIVDAKNLYYSSADGVLFNKEKTSLLAWPYANGSIAIPDGVTSIGAYAFSGCSSLTSIAIPASVTSIGQGAFEACSSLASISLPFIGGSASSKRFLGYIFGASSYSENGQYVPQSLKTVAVSGACSSIADYAFAGCSSLTSIAIPEGVTSIGTYAFYGCSSLTSIAIPEGVTSIGRNAFSGCSSLTSIAIPDGVTYIGAYAFSSCSSLTSISLPFVGGSASSNRFLGYIFGASSYSYNGSSVPKSLRTVIISGACSSIAGHAFYGCSSLTSVAIPDGVTSIGHGAFEGCSSLTSVAIPDGVTSIADRAFYGCSSLASIAIPDGVTSIADYAFYGCSSLTSVAIPSSVKSIGAYAFYGCSSLASITIPDGVTYIDGYAFSGCSSLASITIPDGVTSIADCAFYGCSSLASITIPSSVKSIHDSAFYGCFSLTSVAIPSSITSIGDRAFYGCSSLASVAIPDGVIGIGRGAFEGCSSLASISLPFVGGGNSSDRFLGYIFGASSYSENGSYVPQSLRTVILSGACSSIADYAFYGCSSLTSVAIPASVKSIGDYAFSGCTSLTSVAIPDGVTSIGQGAFEGCSSLASISLPFVGGSASSKRFLGYIFGVSSSLSNGSCVPQSLRTVILSGACSSIADYAFRDCSSLTSVAIPDGVTSIGDYAFYGCSSLASITIPDGVTYIGDYAFRACSSLTSVAIPSSVTVIRVSAFSGCSSLASITIPSSVKSIGNYAFSGCTSLTSVAIPDGVTSIGVSAFYGCVLLTDIYFVGNCSDFSNNIQKGNDWNYGVPTSVVHCSDGDVSI